MCDHIVCIYISHAHSPACRVTERTNEKSGTYIEPARPHARTPARPHARTPARVDSRQTRDAHSAHSPQGGRRQAGGSAPPPQRARRMLPGWAPR